MDNAHLQKTYDKFNRRDAELAARQAVAQTDGERFKLERLRRCLLVLLDATIEGERDDDFIGQVEREIAGQQRAA